jgi:GNAT superfamily N-acetyltransferase
MIILRENVLPGKEQFFRLFESTGWNEAYPLDREQLYEALQHSWYSISAHEGHRLVGFGRVLSDGVLHGLIVELIVLPGYQGRGIGSDILNRLVKRCQAKGIRDIQLFCARGKTGFYEKHGFVKRPEEAPGMGIKFEGL